MDEERDDEFASRCAADPLWFMETCLSVTSKDGRLVPFRLNAEQLDVMRLVWAKLQAKEAVRIIVLKSRQLGISTLFEALGYWMTTTRSHTTGLVLAHEKDPARLLLGMTHRFFDTDSRHDRPGMMPMRQRAARDELRLDNPSYAERARNPGLDSVLRVATADNRSAGHGSTLQFFHGSEVSRYKRPEVMVGVLNALAKMPGTMGFLESTACGASGIFYDTWMGAKNGENEWTPVFLSWRGRPEYSLNLRGNVRSRFEDGLTPRELLLQQEHSLSIGELAWRRAMLQGPACSGIGRDPEDVFREQYPLTPEEAFIATGRQYFDLGALVEMRGEARKLACRTGVLRATRRTATGRQVYGKPDALDFEDHRGASLKVWKEPAVGSDYVVGADVAAGLRGGDFSVAYVMERHSMQFVAAFRGLVEPDMFAQVLTDLAWYYNEAFLAPEANAIGATVAKKCQGRYLRLCYQQVFKGSAFSFGDVDTDRPGFMVSVANRVHIYAALRQAIRERSVSIPDDDFYREAITFLVPERSTDGKLDENRPRGQKGKKDDTVSAAAITFWVNQPQIAGPIRLKKPELEKHADWKRRALVMDVQREPGRDRAHDRDHVYDEHTGEEIA